MREYRISNPEKIRVYARKSYDKTRDSWTNRSLLRAYGISLEQYKELYRLQNGECAICLKKHDGYDPKGNKRRLDVDHCHKTKRVRGLLCLKCNRSIGMMDDSPEILERAVRYLRER